MHRSLYDFGVAVRDETRIILPIEILKSFDENGYVLDSSCSLSEKKLPWESENGRHLLVFESKETGMYYALIHKREKFFLYYENIEKQAFNSNEYTIRKRSPVESYKKLTENIQMIDQHWKDIFASDKRHETALSRVRGFEICISATAVGAFLDCLGMNDLISNYYFILFGIVSAWLLLYWSITTIYEQRRMETYMKARKYNEHEIKDLRNAKRKIFAKYFLGWEVFVFLLFHLRLLIHNPEALLNTYAFTSIVVPASLVAVALLQFGLILTDERNELNTQIKP